MLNPKQKKLKTCNIIDMRQHTYLEMAVGRTLTTSRRVLWWCSETKTEPSS